ncbi:MAG TPA: hypothetical protein PKM63_13280 [Panacibacter sp.]|nr:hypothetical protein [Panacibacter sp.]HNP45255.1 hypothetical protein [Panacibacter sp.]
MKQHLITSMKASVALFIIMLTVIFSCQKSISDKQTNQSVSTNADEVSSGSIAPYNLDVALSGDGKGVGLLRFRQKKDSARIINLDTWVWHLEPNHPYLLQRAVDSIKFGNCFSTAWLTLGLGATPASIRTDASGSGKANLWRDISAISPGTEFYIHFQVIDSVSAAVVLKSDCYTYSVR